MNLVFISDTHCQLDKITIPEGDILIHSGDLTYRGNISEISEQLNILYEKTKNFKHRILICGNHDWLGERNPELMRQLCHENNIIYLDHEAIQIEGINFFGSAFTPEFFSWAFNVERGEKLKEKWETIPANTNVLITHGPMYGILDKVTMRGSPNKGEHVGCMDLRNKILNLKDLKVHVYGHIHEGYGITKQNGITFINASICTESYKPTNKPYVINYEQS